MKTDFLVIGSGIAGLSFAIKTAKALPEKKVTIICKSIAKETNTKYAQGGIAVVNDLLNDSTDKHIQDTILTGGNLCNKKVVEFVVKEGPERLAELIQYGVHFDKTKEKEFDLAKEGGHGANRIFHKGDYTGLEIERKLLAEIRKTPNIILLTHTVAIDLITEKHLLPKKNSGLKTCYGAFVLLLKKQQIKTIRAKITVMATGGLGQVFEHTTNSKVATGDGIAMAYRANAKISNMEFIQFHPTALFETENGRNFLISEAVRGFGGILKTKDGHPFMKDYDPRKDLATRDVVSRAINTELKKDKSCFVYLDCRHISKKEFVKHFPTISTKCIGLGIDPAQTMIPVVPSAHYCCGGISTDFFGNTSVKNLYACGECALTGLHGSNRLASNSLLEALVFAHRCYLDSLQKINKIKWAGAIKELTFKYKNEREINSTESVKNTIKRTMNESVGIITNFTRLEEGIKKLEGLSRQNNSSGMGWVNLDTLQVRNILCTSLLILKSSKKRKENQGVFFNSDLTLQIKQTIKGDINPYII